MKVRGEFARFIFERALRRGGNTNTPLLRWTSNLCRLIRSSIFGCQVHLASTSIRSHAWSSPISVVRLSRLLHAVSIIWFAVGSRWEAGFSLLWCASIRLKLLYRLFSWNTFRGGLRLFTGGWSIICIPWLCSSTLGLEFFAKPVSYTTDHCFY